MTTPEQIADKVRALVDRGRAEVAKARKAAVAVAGVVGQVVALGVLHGTTLHYAQVALAALTAVGVYQFPNETKRPWGL